MVKNLPANAGVVRDVGLILELGRFPERGYSNSLQYSCLRIPWTEEPGGLQFMGSQRVGRNLSDLVVHTHIHADNIVIFEHVHYINIYTRCILF